MTYNVGPDFTRPSAGQRGAAPKYLNADKGDALALASAQDA